MDNEHWQKRESLQTNVDKWIAQIRELETLIIKAKTDFLPEVFKHYSECTGFTDGETVLYQKCVKKDTYEWVDAKIKFSWSTAPYIHSYFSLYVVTDDGKEHHIASPWTAGVKKKPVDIA